MTTIAPMTARRAQHLVPASAVLALAATVTFLSFTQEPAEAFLFPRIISVAMLALAAWNFARAALGLARVGSGVDTRGLVNIAPGLAVVAALIFAGLMTLGFYAASFLGFLAIYTIYDPVPLTDGRGWVRRIAVSAAFMTVVYGLFSRVLQVQTPHGLLF